MKFKNNKKIKAIFYCGKTGPGFVRYLVA